MMTDVELGHNLRKLREKLHFTQEIFGKFVGDFTKAQIQMYEKGQRKIPIQFLLAMKDKGLPVEDIIGSAANDSVLVEVIHYLSIHLKTQKSLRHMAATLQHMAETLSQVVDEDTEVLRTVLEKLNHNKPPEHD